MFYLVYAWKSMIQRRRQYVSLFAVCIASVCIIVSLLAMTDGMINALNKKSVQYYGGELQLICGDRWNLPNPDEKIDVLKPYFEEEEIRTYFTKRFDYSGENTQFFYEGENTLSRILKGIDFNAEKELLKEFTLVSGSVDDAGYDCILISEPVAKKLGCSAGDNITVMMRTIYGYTNTKQLKVSAIFQDSSLYGMYTSYLDINSLIELSGYPKDYVNRLGIFTPDHSLSRKEINRLQSYLETKINMSPIPSNKEQYQRNCTKTDTGIYALITLDANRPEVNMMKNALRLVVYLIIIPLVLIVAIGIGCTYRVVILKRIVETSTFRALGLESDGVKKLFFVEVLLILLVGFIAGLLLSFVITGILGTVNFSFIPAFDLFLIGGKIVACYSLLKISAVLVIISVSTLCAVYFTLRKIIHISPARAFMAAE